jgi:hypothetical protein
MNRPCRFFRPLCLALLLLPLFTFSQSGYGAAGGSEWISLGRTENFRAYLDQRSVQRNGDLVRVFQLTDFATAQWVDERTVVGSIRSLVEYDCSQPRARTLSLEAYSEQMGEGRLVASEQKPDADWSGVAPGGIGENTRKLICSK